MTSWQAALVAALAFASNSKNNLQGGKSAAAPVTTKNGDKGSSRLFSGETLPKDDIHFEVLGNLDELSSLTGLIRTRLDPQFSSLNTDLREIQKILHDIMAACATNPASPQWDKLPLISQDTVNWLEAAQEAIKSQTNIAPGFVIPGDQGPVAAWLDFGRAVARRCERSFSAFAASGAASQQESWQANTLLTRQFLNRLSDFMFIAARYAGSR